MRLIYFLTSVFLVSLMACKKQIKNARTETVRIYGNCERCEKTIEGVGTIEGIAKVDWDHETEMATITYDTSETDMDEILKRVALAGYDNDEFTAPNEAYDKLHECCQYERKAATE